MLVNNPNIYQLKKFIPLFLLLTLFGIGVLVATLMSQQSQDNRNKASTPTGGGQIYVNTVSNYGPGQQSSTQVHFNTGGYQIDGVQMKFTLSGEIPPDFAFVKDPSLTNFEVVSATVSASTYQIALITTNPSTPYTTNASTNVLGTINFTNPESGTLNLTFDPAATKMITHATSEDILLTPTNATFNFTTQATPTPTLAPSGSPTSSPTSSPTTTPSGSPTTNSNIIEAQFKGVSSDVGTIKAVVKIDNVATQDSPETINVDFTYFAGDIYRATINPTTPLLGSAGGNTYTVSVKPEKHLARSLTNLSLSPTYTMSFTSQNGKVFEPGDLSTQDGVVDDNDINSVLNIFTKPTQTAADLAIADVNYDGVVNAIDLGLILSTLSVKPDEAPF